MQRQGKKQQPQAAAFSAAGNSGSRRKMQRQGKKQHYLQQQETAAGNSSSKRKMQRQGKKLQHKQQHSKQQETAEEIVQNICAVGERKLQSWQGNGKETA